MASQNEMDPKFYEAAAEGNFAAFNNLSSSDLQHLLTPNKNTILHLHITANWQERVESTEFVVKILDLCPPLLLQRNTKGETPLYMAARSGLFHTVKALIERAKLVHKDDLERGIEEAKQMLRMRTNDNDTALHEAVRYKYVGIVQLLTEEEPELSYSTNDAGETPLYLAAERGFREVVSEILRSRTLPAHGGPNGLTALHAAVIRNDEGITREILDVKGAELTKEADQQGWTPLHYAAYLGHLSMVEMLLKIDISSAYLRDSDGNRTALHLATGCEHINIVKMLISRCPGCWEVVDKKGRNFIHIAAGKEKREEFCEIIINNTMLSDLLNEKDNDENTPLHLFVASSTNLDPPLRFLTTHSRVDKMAFNKKNLNAIDLANDHMDSVPMKKYIIKALEKAGAKSGMRNTTYKEVKEMEVTPSKQLEPSEQLKPSEQLMKAKETHLIVATLIATVTFAAGFTLPGGEDKGRPILKGKLFFRLFTFSDYFAMALSCGSVFIHLLMALPRFSERKDVFVRLFTLAFFLTIFALGTMFLAFVTGLYAVLEPSLGYDIVACFLGLFMFLFCSFMLKISLPI